eukprot:evm.model.scf_2821.3 EVM.evm.TU.scf_2821.3   scf_2821:17042-17932(+)
MGVRGLATWINSQRIQSRIKLEASGCLSSPQLIVFDAMGCLRRYVDPSTFILDFGAMRDRVRADVLAFRRAGFELLVVFDAGIDVEKFDKWIERRCRDLELLKTINRFLTLADPGPLAPDDWRPPTSTSMYLGQAFRAAGCEVIFSCVDADHEAAWCALNCGACGVLSGDTDFLMYPGIGTFLNCKTLEIAGGRIFVDAVDKRGLMSRLEVSESQLAAMVGVLGNDCIGRPPGDVCRALTGASGCGNLVEAASWYVRNTPVERWLPGCREAVLHYRPVEPAAHRVDHPLTSMVQQQR